MNEFVARNGLIALDSSSISGPFVVTGSIYASSGISTTGSIGIGTNSPDTPLTIASPNPPHIKVLISTSPTYATTYSTNAINFGGSGQTFSVQNNGNTAIRIDASSNVGIGITSPSATLHVSGSAIVSNGLTVTGSILTTGDLTIRGTFLIFGGPLTVASIRSVGTLNKETLQYIAGPIPSDTNLSDHTFGNGQGDIAITSGTRSLVSIARGFNPSSGTGVYNFLSITGTVSQSNATGISRGIHIAPTITNAADYRAVQWDNNSNWGLYGAGTAPNYLAGNLGIGVTSPSGKLHVNGTSVLSGSVLIGSSNGTNAGTWINSSGTITVIRSINGATYGLRVHNGAGWSGHNGIEAIAYQYPIYGAQGSNGSVIASLLSAGAGVFGTGGVGVQGLGATPAGDSGSIGVMASTLFVNNASNTALYDRNVSAHIVGTSQTVLKVDSGTVSNILFITSSGNVGIGTSSPTYKLDINGSFRATGSITATSGSDYFDVSHDITQPAQTGSQVYEVNITPTFRYTAPNQTQTALRVAATFSGSTALSSSQSNIIADFGSTSAGSQLVINDTTSGSIYMVNDVSGIPIIEANSNWDVFIYDYPNVVLKKTGSAIEISGSLTIASGSNNDLYMYGHKMFSVGAFQSDQTQSGSANVSQSITYTTTDYSNGVTYVSGSRLTVANAGVYNIQFSAQVDRVSGSGTDTVYIWLKKNGTNVTNSAGAITIAGTASAAKIISSWNYVVDAAASDYFELCWQTTDSNIQLINLAAAGNIPGIPSIIVTVTQVR